MIDKERMKRLFNGALKALAGPVENIFLIAQPY